MVDPTAGELVIVTGMTGAGRSTAAKELEDLGYFVVDNLPPTLVRDVVRLVDDSRGIQQPIAVVVDVRSGVVLRLAPGQPAPAGDRPADHAALPRGHRRRPRPPPGGRPSTRTRCRAAAGCSHGLQREREVLGRPAR